MDMNAIEILAPDSSTKVKQLLLQLKVRRTEIEAWFQTEPSRLDMLQKDPESTIGELFYSMKLGQDVPLGRPDLKEWEIILKPIERHEGKSLLRALWQHVSSSEVNYQNFTTYPFQVIDTVASDTNASVDEKSAVILMFEHGLGISHIDASVLDTFRLIPEGVPS
jgi:hypothetical protein